MKKFIAEVVPLESCVNELLPLRCSEEGIPIGRCLVYNLRGVDVFEDYGNEYLVTPVSTGKYFALKFTEITNGI